MREQLLAAAGVAAIGGIVVLPASAHHSYAEFDRSKTVEIAGAVEEWHWVNPHSWLYVTAPGPMEGDGDVVWAIETGSSANMSRIPGWSRTMMKPGDEVTVVLNPRRDGGAGGSLVSVTLPDGETIALRLERPRAEDESPGRGAR